MNQKNAISDLVLVAYTNALKAGTAQSTRRAYNRDLRYFWAWASESLNINPIYPVSTETLIRFALEHSGHMSSEVEQELIRSGLKSKAGPLCIRTIRRYIYRTWRGLLMQ